jgi:hypothetical protein
MTWEELAAVLTGIGAVLSGYASLYVTRKRMRKECDERVEEIKAIMLEMEQR